MSDILVAKRYAKALFKVCGSDDGVLDEAQKVLDSLSQLFTDASIGKVLTSPSMPKDLKLQILEHVAGKVGSHKDITNFLKVSVDAGRIEIFAQLNGVFRDLLNDRRGVVDATVSSVVALSQEELQSTKENLEKLTGKKVRLKAHLDPELLGGILVRIGHKVIDLSLKSRLNRVARSAIV